MIHCRCTVPSGRRKGGTRNQKCIILALMVVSIRMAEQSDFSIPAVGRMGERGWSQAYKHQEVVAPFVLELIQEGQKKQNESGT